MLKIEPFKVREEFVGYQFYCKGCKMHHAFYIKEFEKGGNPVWTFNGDLDNPTFSPSLRVQWANEEGDQQCHLFLRNGEIQYLGDCTHDLAGKTLKL